MRIDFTLCGKMSTVTGIRECSTCKWARIHQGSRTTVSGNKVCNQSAGIIVDCTNSGPKSMDMSGKGMKCSGYTPK